MNLKDEYEKFKEDYALSGKEHPLGFAAFEAGFRLGAAPANGEHCCTTNSNECGGGMVIAVAGRTGQKTRDRMAQMLRDELIVLIDESQLRPEFEPMMIDCRPIQWETSIPDRETNAKRCGYSTKFKK